LDTSDLDIQLLNAEASLSMAEVNVATAEHNLGMMRTLYGAQAIPVNELRQAEFAHQSALALRQQAQAQVQSTRITLQRAVLTSPINGTVTAAVAQEGSVGMGLMFIIEDTDSLRVMTSFREYDLGRVTPGMAVGISSDATGDIEYEGIISRINPAATLSFPVPEFEAEVLVTSPETRLRIGMNARLNIILER
jgi:multidrug resistance efflux pump